MSTARTARLLDATRRDESSTWGPPVGPDGYKAIFAGARDQRILRLKEDRRFAKLDGDHERVHLLDHLIASALASKAADYGAEFRPPEWRPYQHHVATPETPPPAQGEQS